MSVNRIRLRDFYCFRVFGESYDMKRGPGLYFGDNSSIDKNNWKRISPSEAIAIRDWLSRYINEFHLKTIPVNVPDMKAKSRAIIRGLEKIEAEQ